MTASTGGETRESTASSGPAQSVQPTAPCGVGAVGEFANGPERHLFRFRYGGSPQPLHAYLLGRYRFGRPEHWVRSFYPARVRLNGAVVDAGTTVLAGDEIAYLHLRADEPPPPPLAAPLHADPWLVALAKPDTLPVNPAGVFYFGCLAIHAREALDNPELTPLHRLDLETSGPLLFATRRAHVGLLQSLFRDKTLVKRYRALVHGRFPLDLRVIAGHIVPDTGSRIHTRLRLEPAPAEAAAAALPSSPRRERHRGKGDRLTAPEVSLTRIHQVIHHTVAHPVTGAPEAVSELVLEPVTGKTNQLRVHLAHVGHPIVGDKKYHPDAAVFLDWHAHRDFERLAGRLWLPRQALHCEMLAFAHPATGEPLEIRAPAEMWRAKLALLAL